MITIQNSQTFISVEQVWIIDSTDTQKPDVPWGVPLSVGTQENQSINQSSSLCLSEPRLCYHPVVCFLCIYVRIFSFILFLSRICECDGWQRCFASSLTPPLTWLMSDSCSRPESSLRIFVWHSAAQPLRVHVSDQQLNKNLRGKTAAIAAWEIPPYSPFNRCNHLTLMAAF